MASLRLRPLVTLGLFSLIGLAGCVTPVGQKVTVLLLNDTVPCSGPAFAGPGTEGPDYTSAYPASATVVLDQVDDLYMLQFNASNADVGHSRPTLRNGLEVTVPCTAGESELIIRRASILQARSSDETTSPGGSSTPPPGGS